MRSKFKVYLSIAIVLLVSIILIFINLNKKVKNDDYILDLYKFDFKDKIDFAESKIDKSKKSIILKDKKIKEEEIGLIFEGAKDEDIVNEIIKLLDSYKKEGTFFLSGIDVLENENILININNKGKEVGNGTLNNREDMDLLSDREFLKEVVSTNEIIKSKIKTEPKYLRLNNSKINDRILYLSKAANIDYVVKSDIYLNYQSFKSYDEVYDYIKNIKNGSLVTIKLEGILTEEEYLKDEKNNDKAKDKASTIKEGLSENKDLSIIQILEWIFRAMKENKKEAISIEKFISRKEIDLNEDNEYLLKDNLRESKEESLINYDNLDGKIKKALIKNNNNKGANVNRFYTTMDSVAYTFRNIENTNLLNTILNSLDKIGALGTFFVTKDEIENNYKNIDLILKRGHEIANGGITRNSNLLDLKSEEIMKEILEVDKLLYEKGIKTYSYMPGNGFISEDILTAISAINTIEGYEDYELITYSKAPLNSTYEGDLAGDIVREYFNITFYTSLSRGEIVYFNLGAISYIEEGEIVKTIELIKERYIDNCYVYKYNGEVYELDHINLGYSVVPLSILKNSQEGNILGGRYNFTNNFTPLIEREVDFNFLTSRYIGNRNVNLDSFSEEERNLIDKEGIIETKGVSTIFITIDDFGNEGVTNNILKVLDKHKSLATFFPTAINVEPEGRNNSNPNLLRKIALRGHDIGSHNYNHELINGKDEGVKEYIVKAYKTINKVIGDTGRFVSILKPPTLAVSKEGIETTLKSGFDYVVSGNISTRDYERSSAMEIVEFVEANLVKGKGNILIMHCNNQSYFTAEAIDILLENNKNGKYGDVYEVRLLREYLK